MISHELNKNVHGGGLKGGEDGSMRQLIIQRTLARYEFSVQSQKDKVIL